MRSSRHAVLLAALVLALTTLGFASAASAQNYPGTPTITLSKTRVPEGGTLSVSCTGFMPNGQVRITLAEPPVDLGTVTVDGSGNLVKDITLPPGTTVGPHTVSCTGPGDDGQIVTVTAELVVTPAGTTPTTTNTGSLPRTGSDSTTLLRIAVVLIVGGAALALVFRRRSSESTDA